MNPYKAAERLLQDHEYHKSAVENLTKEIREIESELPDGIRATDYTQDKVTSSGPELTMVEQTAFKKLERIWEKQMHLERIKSKVERVERALGTLEADEKIVLLMYYTNNQPLYIIKVKIHKSYRTTGSIKREGMRNFVEALYGEG